MFRPNRMLIFGLLWFALTLFMAYQAFLEKQIPNTFLHDILHGWLQNPTFSNIIPRAKHVLNTSKCTFISFSLYTILFAPVISTSIHRCMNNSHDIKVLMKVIVVFWLVNTSSSNNKRNYDMWGQYLYLQERVFTRERLLVIGT